LAGKRVGKWVSPPIKTLLHILLFFCSLLLASSTRAAEQAKPAPDDTITIADLRSDTSAIFHYGTWEGKVAVTKSGLVVLGAKGAQGAGGFGHDLGSSLDFTAVTEIELALAVVPGNKVPAVTIALNDADGTQVSARIAIDQLAPGQPVWVRARKAAFILHSGEKGKDGIMDWSKVARWHLQGDNKTKKPCSVAFIALRARGDYAGYTAQREISTNNGTLTFRHVHNWGSTNVETLFFDFAHHDKFFSPANDFAYVELRDSSGKLLFRSPSPALTKLWISPDSKFVVGLSDVMFYNPYQLVVWRSDGSLVHREHISARVAKMSLEEKEEFAKRFPRAEKFLAERYFLINGNTYLDYSLRGVPNEIGRPAWDFLRPLRAWNPYSDDFSESVTNWVYWFDPEHTELSIAQQGSDLALFLRSPTGMTMTVPLGRR